MTTACFLITHYPVKVELSRRPDYVGRPVVVYMLRGSRTVVLDHSPQASGVSAGMTLEASRSRCPAAVLVQADEQYYQATFKRLIKEWQQCVEKVELAEPGCAYIGSTELTRANEGDTSFTRILLNVVDPGWNPRIGIGYGKFAAYSAARSSGPGQATVMPHDVAGFLKDKPISWLPLSTGIKTRLHKYGLETLGDIVDVGIGPMQAQFTAEGKQAFDLAQGIDPRPLHPEPYQEEISESLEFPSSVIQVEAIALAAEQLLQKLFARRGVKGKYVQGIVARGQIDRHAPWTKTITFKEPLGRWEDAHFIFRNALDTQTFGGPLEDLSINLVGVTGEIGRQLSLLGNVRDDANLADALRQLELKFGKPISTRVLPWQPESPFPERRFVNDQLKPLNPPELIEVDDKNQNERPSAVLVDRRWRNVLSIKDLWVIEDTEWWSGSPSSRNYYEVLIRATGDGARSIIIYRDAVDGKWYRQRA